MEKINIDELLKQTKINNMLELPMDLNEIAEEFKISSELKQKLLKNVYKNEKGTFDFGPFMLENNGKDYLIMFEIKNNKVTHIIHI
ncbi:MULTISPECIES: hypothetical protein [Bacillus cereus group]|uniref:hypothetical protein n=1 Tax=Bacillus cereus group TaxID=86661 RepID=UPI0005CF6CB4|nr:MULTISPECIES: hypothetical protein [Bacillus cereus group]